MVLLVFIAAVSLYVLDRNRYSPKPSLDPFRINPYKRKRRVRDEEKVSPSVREKYIEQILDLVLYDVENCQTLTDFEPVKMNTECIFAKKSRIWGACDYDRTLSVGKQATVALIKACSQPLNLGAKVEFFRWEEIQKWARFCVLNGCLGNQAVFCIYYICYLL